MIGKSQKLIHPGTSLERRTPWLIPSFSSKGFGYNKGTKKSSLLDIIEAAAPFITDSCLISAYDVHYGHVHSPNDLPVKPDLFVVDSGGYEISSDSDYSTVLSTQPVVEAWTFEMYSEFLKNWPSRLPAAFVSFDHPDIHLNYEDQVTNARKLFKGENEHLHIFLIKPETNTQHTLKDVLDAVTRAPNELSSFHIIGVTEKELGNSLLQRMERIAKLRRILDGAGNTAPIHVFGALDPLTVCFYLLAGAQIFDGLTWLRYGYLDGIAAYRNNWAGKECPLSTKDADVMSRLMASNLYALEVLEQWMKKFVHTGDFNEFKVNAKAIEEAWGTLDERLN